MMLHLDVLFYVFFVLDQFIGVHMTLLFISFFLSLYLLSLSFLSLSFLLLFFGPLQLTSTVLDFIPCYFTHSKTSSLFLSLSVYPTHFIPFHSISHTVSHVTHSVFPLTALLISSLSLFLFFYFNGPHRSKYKVPFLHQAKRISTYYCYRTLPP